VIIGFRDPETEKVFQNVVSRKFPANIQTTALRKLLQLNAAVSLNSLRVPPGNRLEALKGSRMSQHSIRINDQWRVCFVWLGTDAEEAEIVDYH
jgi:proteic killer suppression protein